MPRTRKTGRHLPPCVYERHGAFWYVKKNKWTRLGKTLAESLERYAELVSQPAGGMAELIDKALAHISPKLDPNTRAQYETASRHLKRRMIEFAPRQVKPKHVAAIKTDMAGTPNMANRALSLLRQVFALAVEWQLVDSNPCIGIRRLPEKKRGRYISDEEYRAIYAQAGDRLQVIIDLLYLTGQRVRDVLSIRYADLTDDGIVFEPEKTSSSTGVGFTVQWTPELRLTVERAKGLYGNVRALTLLHGRTGRPPDYRTVALQWEKARSRAKVEDAQLRDLRAKALTDAEAQGHDPTALAGHTSPQMTRRYLRRRQRPLVSGPSLSQPNGRLREK
jgi:integrase